MEFLYSKNHGYNVIFMFKNETETTPYLWMLFASFSFASMSALVHGLGTMVNSPFIVLIRTVVVLVVLLTIARSSGIQLVFWKPRALWLRSIAGTIGTLTSFYAMTQLPISNAITIIHMFPLWVALLSWPLFGIIPNFSVWVSITCGFLGIVLLHPPEQTQQYLAMLAALVGSFSAALAMTGLHLLRDIDSRAIVIHFAMILIPVTILTLLVATWESGFTVPTDPITWWMLLGVGGFATCGQVSMTKAFASGPPARIAIVALSQVAITMIYDVIFWDRSFQGITLLGITLIIGPTAWIMIRDAIPTGDPARNSDGSPKN